MGYSLFVPSRQMSGPLSVHSLWLSRQVFENCLGLRHAWHPFETGGMLLGWRNDDSSLVATGLIGGGPNAVHRVNSFLPDDNWQAIHMRRSFELSNGDLDYLGEWHSHPSSPAKMSWVDKSTLRKTAKVVADPVMIIVGTLMDGIEVNAWIGAGSFFARHMSIEVMIFDAPQHWPTYFAFDGYDLDPPPESA